MSLGYKIEPYENQIRKALIDKGKKQKDLAYEVGCSQSYVSRVLNGTKEPSEKFTGYIEGMFGIKYHRRVVVCAACKVNGVIFAGVRHYCPIMHSQAQLAGDMGKVLTKHHQAEEQGFVDNFYNFLTRKEALKLAIRTGQVKKGETFSDKKLFSEDLY